MINLKFLFFVISRKKLSFEIFSSKEFCMQNEHIPVLFIICRCVAIPKQKTHIAKTTSSVVCLDVIIARFPQIQRNQLYITRSEKNLHINC